MCIDIHMQPSHAPSLPIIDAPLKSGEAFQECEEP